MADENGQHPCADPSCPGVLCGPGGALDYPSEQVAETAEVERLRQRLYVALVEQRVIDSQEYGEAPYAPVTWADVDADLMTRPATHPPFTFTIAPGHHSDDPTAAREREARVVDAILGTEATHWPFNVPGWVGTVGQGVEGESFVAIGPRFKFARSWAEPLTKGGGRNRFKNPTYAACLVAQDTLTGHMVGFIGVHLRAHNFKGSKRYRPENIVAWWQGFRGLRRARRRMNRYYPGCCIVIAGDPNATRRNFFARAVHKTFPNASLGWGGPFSSALLWGLRVLSVRTVDPGAASDHPWKRLTVAYRAGVVAVGGGRRG